MFPQISQPRRARVYSCQRDTR